MLRFKFNTRALLVFVGIVSALLAVSVPRIKTAVSERHSARILGAHGFGVYTDSDFGPDGKLLEPWVRDYPYNTIWYHFNRRIIDVALFDKQNASMQLREAHEELKRLQSLRRLSLRFAKVSDNDMKYVAAVRQLNTLDLCGTEITDKSIAVIMEIEGLHTVNVSRTGITASGVELLSKHQKLSKILVDKYQFINDSTTSANCKIVLMGVPLT